MAGIYVHIPFCRSRCIYCDFFSTTRSAAEEAYVEAVCREAAVRRDELTGTQVQTIYFGGGTPSLLHPASVERVLQSLYAGYDINADAEVTLEMNPDDVDSWQPAGLGINRVSLGLQTFDDSLLRTLRRRHDGAAAIRAVRRLQQQGIGNISIDLIYGLPGQSLAAWERDLRQALALGVQHLSAYALSCEPGTPLADMVTQGRLTLPGEEVCVAMYDLLLRLAGEAGFEHYEISNFALPGYRSRHNSSYWSGKPYVGLGPGAHSYDGRRTRRANLPHLDHYLAAFGKEPQTEKTAGCPKHPARHDSPPSADQALFEVETLSDAEVYDEAVMCGLRTCEGIDLSSIARRCGETWRSYLLHMAAPHLKAGRLLCKDDSLRLTAKALMVSDDVMSDLMACTSPAC